jgi:hypothetical protein
MSRILLLIMSIVVLLQASEWKVFGFTAKNNLLEIIVYDQNSIDTLDNGNIKIWTKSFEANKSLENDSTLNEEAAKKIVKGYIPPYAIVNELKYDDMITIIMFEEMANLQLSPTKVKMLSEFNFKEKKYRFLSISIYKNDNISTKSDPGKWDYISPESNYETLHKIFTSNMHRKRIKNSDQ